MENKYKTLDGLINEKSCGNMICKSAFFDGLDCASFHELCKSSRMKSYEKGEIVASDGDSCNAIGIIGKGQIAMQKITSGGDYATIALLSDGDFFGEDTLYSSNSKYSCTLEAMTPCHVQFISKEALNNMMQVSPVIKDNYLRILSDRVLTQNRRIELLSQKTLREKIAYYLIDLYNNEMGHEDKSFVTKQNYCDGCQDCKSCKYPHISRKVTLPVSKEVVAKYLAMPRPSFSRELISMEQDGLIKVKGREIMLCDVARLEMEIVEGLNNN